MHLPDPNLVILKMEAAVRIISLCVDSELCVLSLVGLFMVNYDQQNWGLLLDYLRGTGPQIPTATRAKLLHDAWNLAYAGELDIGTALNMTLFLEQETELAVWEAMFPMIDHLGRRISGTDAGLKFEVSTVAVRDLSDILVTLDRYICILQLG